MSDYKVVSPSPFVGLWTDDDSAVESLERMIRIGHIDPHLEHPIRSFIAEGYAILESAVPGEVCDAIAEELRAAWEHGNERFLTQEPGSQVSKPVMPGLPAERMRVVDIHAVSDHARQALFSDTIVEFLAAVFETAPHLFQSLTFEKGSEQGFHQDPAYVVVSEPRQLAASWIALEDISAGSGELRYLPRSHRIPEFLFSGEFKHWNPERDGHEQHTEWSQYLTAQAASLELQEKRFAPSKGDVLIWAADLVHGGSPVERPELSRRSLVGHYCPAGVSPHYFSYAPHRAAIRNFGDSTYSSFHIDLESYSD